MKRMQWVGIGLTLTVAVRAQEAAPRVPPPEQRARQVQVFDVRDLVLPAPELTEAGAVTAAGQQQLVALLSAFLPRGAEPLPDAGALRLTRGSLVTQLDAEQTEWVDRVLALQREAGATLIQLEAVAIAGIPPDHELLAERGAPRALAADESAAALLAALGRVPGVRSLPPLQLALVPCTPGNAQALQHVSYIKAWDVEHGVQPGNRTILDPVIDVVRGGTTLDGSALLLPDHTVGLEVSFSLIDLRLPIPSSKVVLEGHELEIGTPQAPTTKIAATVALPVGRTILLSTPRGQAPGVLLLLTVKSLQRPGELRRDRR